MKKENKNMNVSSISKVVVSSGLGRTRQANAQFDDKVLPGIMSEFAAIVGQKPAVRKAKKSIAGFKLRQNETVGIVATLRGKRKDDFLLKLANVVLPRLRDFRGISDSHLDKAGNLSIGFKDQSVFPEINPEASKWSFGLEVTIVAKFKDRDAAIDFYRQIGIPLTVA
jgi:large subunit ribosomal protein L5